MGLPADRLRLVWPQVLADATDKELQIVNDLEDEEAADEEDEDEGEEDCQSEHLAGLVAQRKPPVQ